MSVLKEALYALILIVGPIFISSASADFLQDSKLNLGMRNFYINSDFREGHTGPSKAEEWAQGVRLRYQSGFTDGRLGMGLDAIGLQGLTLDSGRGRHQGSTVLNSEGDRAADQWSHLGLSLKLKTSATELHLGTQMPNLPVLVYSDTRPLPQTYQGAILTSREIDGLTLISGKLTQAVGRASSDSTGMAVTGGQQQSNDFRFVGFDYKPRNDLLLQLYQSSLDDYYRQQFVGAIHTWKLADGRSLKTDLRYFRTRGEGANASGTPGYQVAGFTPGGDGVIDNDTWSLTFNYANRGHGVLLGYQQVSDDSNFVQPNQGTLVGGVGAGGASSYLTTERILSNFGRAGQATGIIQYGYDFAASGLPGLGLIFNHQNSSAIKTLRDGDRRERETDLILNYVIQSGPASGLAITLMQGWLRSEVVPDQDQVRLVLNYNLSLF
ncbi:OprD family outer membrane porin [Pseudomonas piscis]|uniref:OprD family outer membrane porin n=1 Tax=Pseudomonas piscis TaxID=2614538 RepID=UPI0039A6D78E